MSSRTLAAESSADFAVSQDCILQTNRNCQSTQVSSDACRLRIRDTAPQTRADAGRYAFGLASATGVLRPKAAACLEVTICLPELFVGLNPDKPHWDYGGCVSANQF